MKKPIYMDYNGTTPHDPEVVTAMRRYIEDEFGNPSSSHMYGIEPKRAVELARRQIASFIGCKPADLIFTSGGTESNNYAIFGTIGHQGLVGKKVITSAIEHPAILEPLKSLESRGVSVTYVPVDEFGCVSCNDIESNIDDRTVLITIMHSNNEVGSIQPIEAISDLARRRGIIFHTDASQSLGKTPCVVDSLGVDMLTIAGHKLYAPKGIGALYVKPGTVLTGIMYGAGQEMGKRPGTENVVGIVGLGKACELAQQSLSQNISHMKTLRDKLKRGFERQTPEIRFNGHPERSLPNTLNVSFRGLEANRILEEIGLDVAASAGAACHSDHVKISHVLEAMKVPVDYAMGAIRFSLGRQTTEKEIDRTLEVVCDAVRRLRMS